MEYKFEVTYKNVKYLRMKVKGDIVKISCPFFTSKKTLQKFINDNKDFIDKGLEREKLKQQQNVIKINDFITIFDKQYQILSISSKPKVTEHFIFVNENNDISKQIKSLFKDKLYEIMYEKTKYCFDKMELTCPFPKIIIKDVKSKWGSYHKKKHLIEYASQLIFKNSIVYDYLVVHELAHIVYFDHSKQFYELVSKYYKDYKKVRKILKEN